MSDRSSSRKPPAAPAHTRPLFRKVLVANRGEISVRIQQTLRELGITACAVYSEPDRTALHTIKADETYPLGPGPSSESYLSIERILDAARAAEVEAIHPGYGFLSENPAFAQAVVDAGFVFIGPTAKAMQAMGNKLEARRLMEDAGVPVVPGLTKPVQDATEAVAAAETIGYPVLLKAASGGGGKGMRVVRSGSEMASAVERTQGEARSAFGDDSIFVEKFIERPRHIEVQVMGDHQGTVVHLFERECSVQRRHQKVIEESPSPSVTPELRRDLCEAAVRAAKSVGYTNAGTVEFIVDEDDRFFFLEMNARLQVEHPITENVVGVDLVAAQVQVAAGHPVPWAQEELHQRGHAIEFRIYAEDPWNDFAPSLGRVIRLRPPVGAGVRNDMGIREGYAVPIFYDPLLAKLIVRAENRPAAIARGRRALEDYRLLGLTHNIPLHRWVLDEPEFVGGRYSTRLLEERFRAEALAHQIAPDEMETLAAALALVESGVAVTSSGLGDVPPVLSRWGEVGRSMMVRRKMV
jgi:acetyl-CoA carboxylase biotin carboxylase subunit